MIRDLVIPMTDHDLADRAKIVMKDESGGTSALGAPLASPRGRGERSATPPTRHTDAPALAIALHSQHESTDGPNSRS
jgi:hypothetical protein